MNMCWDLDSEGRFVERFTRQGMRLQPPTPPTLSPEGDSLNFEAELPHVVLVPLVWGWRTCIAPPKAPSIFGGG
jgi:hypothetical protein